jgi:predicted nucleic acid-binding protein
MIAYVDSSVILRVVLGQPQALAEWKRIRNGIASALVEVECLRTLDRLRLRQDLPDAEVAVRRTAIDAILARLSLVDPTRPILARAAQPFPTLLGTLDAIHLATALLWRDRNEGDLVVATHDGALATAARACGLTAIGA